MGDPWETVFFRRGGLEGASKNKIGSKTSKSAKK